MVVNLSMKTRDMLILWLNDVKYENGVIGGKQGRSQDYCDDDDGISCSLVQDSQLILVTSGRSRRRSIPVFYMVTYESIRILSLVAENAVPENFLPQ